MMTKPCRFRMGQTFFRLLRKFSRQIIKGIHLLHRKQGLISKQMQAVRNITFLKDHKHESLFVYLSGSFSWILVTFAAYEPGVTP